MTKNECPNLSFSNKLFYIPKQSLCIGAYIGGNIGLVLNKTGNLMGFECYDKLDFSGGIVVIAATFGLVLAPLMVVVESADELLQTIGITNFDITEAAYTSLIGDNLHIELS